jgi:hypothetical protein
MFTIQKELTLLRVGDLVNRSVFGMTLTVINGWGRTRISVSMLQRARMAYPYIKFRVQKSKTVMTEEFVERMSLAVWGLRSSYYRSRRPTQRKEQQSTAQGRNTSSRRKNALNGTGQ